MSLDTRSVRQHETVSPEAKADLEKLVAAFIEAKREAAEAEARLAAAEVNLVAATEHTNERERERVDLFWQPRARIYVAPRCINLPRLARRARSRRRHAGARVAAKSTSTGDPAEPPGSRFYYQVDSTGGAQ